MRLGENCLHLRSPDFTNIMNECPLEHHSGYHSLKEESMKDFAPCHAQLSIRGKRVLDRLLVLLPSHLKSQSTSRRSPFPSTLLLSICNALQLHRADISAEQDDPSVLPSALSKLRDWRLLDPEYRCSPEGIYKLALDLAGITDEASVQTTSDLSHTSHPRLRIKWVGLDSPGESQDRESPSSTPPSPSSSRSVVFDSAQERAHALTDLNKRRSDARYESCQVGRLGTPDSEDSSVVVSPRRHSASGFRSGCSACRHLRLSGLSSTRPLSPYVTSVPFSNVNRFETSTNPFVPSPKHPKPNAQHSSTKKTRREKHPPLQSASRGARVDENEPPLPKPIGIQQGIGVSFPRQRTHSPRISNAFLSREPFSPDAASVRRYLEPSRLINQARPGDKHTFSHRLASVDLRLSMGKHASPSDLHPHLPTRAQSFSYTPANGNALGVGSVGAGVLKLSSNAGESRSSNERLPSWSQTHPTTTTSSPLKSTGSLSPLAVKACLANPHPPPSGTRSRPLSASTPRNLPSDMTHRDRRSVSHKHTSSVGALPLSPFIHARKWQV
ncbi:hypothetical protein L210DRAFT_974203 [Boletus edulis BED1]|uniref:Uncharacterized protein n=1 Tax=Boletus edulis BED1 TaxID=1328754 RepID=A0AAD4BYT4_BOLED|nr:hypothetical protein L210DRAFT_974203 [Boletus edulis BED1]